MQTIGIAGGSGFVGSHLTELLVSRGYKVVIFTRTVLDKKSTPQVRYSLWDPHTKKCDLRLMQELDAVVNLSGAGIADKRWTRKRKQEIIHSRVDSTDFLVETLREHAPNCCCFISSSATGFYGPDRQGMTPFKEDAPAYDDFLGGVCSQWEAAAQRAAGFERMVILRFGIVLGREDGAFKTLAMPVSFGIMPILGSGRQMVSWIHVSDVCRLLLHALETPELQGVYNAVAPQQVTHRQLMHTISRAKGGWRIPIPVPAFLLNLLVGETSTEVLKSCTASAEKTMTSGFQFHYDTIDKAVAELTGKK